MPHVVIKLWPGKSEDQKRRLSDAVVEDVSRILECGRDSISVGFEEIASEDWTRQVYTPDILGKWGTLSKQPGYGPRPADAAPDSPEIER